MFCVFGYVGGVDLFVALLILVVLICLVFIVCTFGSFVILVGSIILCFVLFGMFGSTGCFSYCGVGGKP